MPSPRLAQADRSPRTSKSADTTAARTPKRGGAQARPGSPAQMAQLQRQYGNRATQQMMPTGAPTIQRAGGDDAYKQPNQIMGVTSDPKLTKDTDRDELRSQVTRLIEHAQIASSDFKVMLTGIIDAVNAEIPGGC